MWYDKGEWHGGDIFYEFDRIPRKKTRIADATAKALARDGTEREIDFKSALKLVMDKKAKIQDIAAE